MTKTIEADFDPNFGSGITLMLWPEGSDTALYTFVLAERVNDLGSYFVTDTILTGKYRTSLHIAGFVVQRSRIYVGPAENTIYQVGNWEGSVDIGSFNILGPGASLRSVRILVDGVPTADVGVWLTSDAGGLNVVAGTLQTETGGIVSFLLDVGSTYYVWAQKDGINSIDGSAYIVGSTIITDFATTAASGGGFAPYTNESQMKIIYGVDNINKWADLDNNGDLATIAARIAWAGDSATEYMNGRLVLSRYPAPFANPPKLIILMSSMLGGLLLFDGRLVVSSDPPYDQMARQRKDFNKYIRQLLNGQLRLIHPSSGEVIETTSYNAPFTESERSSDSCTDFCNLYRNNGLYCQGCGCHQHTCVCRSLTLPCW